MLPYENKETNHYICIYFLRYRSLLDYILHHVWILQVFMSLLNNISLRVFLFFFPFPSSTSWDAFPLLYGFEFFLQQVFLWISNNYRLYTIYIKLCHYWCNECNLIIGVWDDILCNVNKSLKCIESGKPKIWYVIYVWLIKNWVLNQTTLIKSWLNWLICYYYI